jgi:hypothetical protein
MKSVAQDGTRQQEKLMNVNDDLLGKTITGVIAHRSRDTGVREIWVLQFDDGSHVEFVSPGGRKTLRRAANQTRNPSSSGRPFKASNQQAGQPVRLADSRSMRYQRECESGAQLTLNVA